MSSWGCQSGHWYTFDCSTTPGTTFSEPITLNVYHPPTTTTYPKPGGLIESVTRTFSIPYRPSANNTHCTGANLGKWYDSSSGTCFNGLAVNITFHLHRHVALPGSVVFGIAYNTSNFGYHPYGVTACSTSSGGCG